MFAKSVLVSGSNRGLGLGLIKQLAGKTQHLFAGCRSPTEAEELQEIAKEHEHVVVLELDVTKSEKVNEAVRKISSIVGNDGLNCLINNAGVIDRFTSIEKVTAESLTYSFQINAIGPAMLAKSCLPLLRKASSCVADDHMAVSRAAVLNITTILASFKQNTSGKNYGYRMSKVALNMLTKNLSIELKHDKILVVNIHPGWVRTDLGGHNAPLSVAKSAEGVIGVASALRKEDTGSFYSWDESQIPW